MMCGNKWSNLCAMASKLSPRVVSQEAPARSADEDATGQMDYLSCGVIKSMKSPLDCVLNLNIQSFGLKILLTSLTITALPVSAVDRCGPRAFSVLPAHIFVQSSIIACDGGFSGPNGTGMFSQDASQLCDSVSGWHICENQTETSNLGLTVSLCSGTPSGKFYATRQRSSGLLSCDGRGTNDVFGCGNGLNLSPVLSNCHPLLKSGSNMFSVYSGTQWNCRACTGYRELVTVQHIVPNNVNPDGGVMCCRQAIPSESPSLPPSGVPSSVPSDVPTDVPTDGPTDAPSAIPSATPSSLPSTHPTANPSENPSESPSTNPSIVPSSAPTLKKLPFVSTPSPTLTGTLNAQGEVIAVATVAVVGSVTCCVIQVKWLIAVFAKLITSGCAGFLELVCPCFKSKTKKEAVSVSVRVTVAMSVFGLSSAFSFAFNSYNHRDAFWFNVIGLVICVIWNLYWTAKILPQSGIKSSHKEFFCLLACGALVGPWDAVERLSDDEVASSKPDILAHGLGGFVCSLLMLTGQTILMSRHPGTLTIFCLGITIFHMLVSVCMLIIIYGERDDQDSQHQDGFDEVPLVCRADSSVRPGTGIEDIESSNCAVVQDSGSDSKNNEEGDVDSSEEIQAAVSKRQGIKSEMDADQHAASESEYGPIDAEPDLF